MTEQRRSRYHGPVAGVYEESRHGQPETGGGMDKTLNPAFGHCKLIYPPRDGSALWLRPLPPLDPDDPGGNLLGGRDKNRVWTAWCVQAKVAFVGFGRQKVSFIMAGPNTSRDEADNDPYYRLFWAAWRAKEKGEYGESRVWNPKWSALLGGAGGGKGGGPGKGGVLSPPSACRYMQGAVWANGADEYVGAQRTRPLGFQDDDPWPIVRITGACYTKLHELVDRRKKQWQGDEDADPNLPYVCGDPVGTFDPDSRTVRGGVFIGVYYPQGPAQTPPYRYTSWNGQIAPQQSYECAISAGRRFGGGDRLPALSDEDVDVVFARSGFPYDVVDKETKKVQPGYLYVPSTEEKCAFIARALRAVPQLDDVRGLLRFGWADNPEYFTEEVRGILAARVYDVVPEAAPVRHGAAQPAARQQPPDAGPRRPAPARADVTIGGAPFAGDDAFAADADAVAPPDDGPDEFAPEAEPEPEPAAADAEEPAFEEAPEEGAAVYAEAPEGTFEDYEEAAAPGGDALDGLQHEGLAADEPAPAGGVDPEAAAAEAHRRQQEAYRKAAATAAANQGRRPATPQTPAPAAPTQAARKPAAAAPQAAHKPAAAAPTQAARKPAAAPTQAARKPAAAAPAKKPPAQGGGPRKK